VTPMRALADEAASIRSLLAKEAVNKRMKELVGQLRKDHLHDENAIAVESIDVTAQGNITPMTRPGVLPRATHPPTGAPRPAGAPGDMR
jgi:hypothetical protein